METKSKVKHNIMKENTKTNNTFLSKDTIRVIYENHCEAMEIHFDKNEFEDLLDFLAIDINDWISGNLRCFHSKERKRLGS